MDQLTWLEECRVRKNSQTKYRIVSGWELLLANVFIVVGVWSSSIWMTLEIIRNNAEGRIPFLIVYWLAMCGMVVCFFVKDGVLARTLLICDFSRDSITVHIPMVGTSVYSYKQYSHMYIGTYFHGNIFGMGMNVYYIVIARRFMSDLELMQINQLANSADAFKIRYTRRMVRKLQKALPTEKAVTLALIAKEIEEKRKGVIKEGAKKRAKKRAK